jgi:hypothetical protein
MAEQASDPRQLEHGRGIAARSSKLGKTTAELEKDFDAWKVAITANIERIEEEYQQLLGRIEKLEPKSEPKSTLKVQ